jgi:hypothetical protein
LDSFDADRLLGTLLRLDRATNTVPGDHEVRTEVTRAANNLHLITELSEQNSKEVFEGGAIHTVDLGYTRTGEALVAPYRHHSAQKQDKENERAYGCEYWPSGFQPIPHAL